MQGPPTAAGSVPGFAPVDVLVFRDVLEDAADQLGAAVGSPVVALLRVPGGTEPL